MVGNTPSNPTPATDTWIDGTTGDWSLAANWSGALVPDGSSNAAIAGTGTETVTVSTDQAASALTLNDPNATLLIDESETLTANGPLTISALQQLDLLGTLSVGGGNLDNATINIGGLVPQGPPGMLFPPMTAFGTLTDQSGSLTLGTNLTVNIADGGINSFSFLSSGFSLINDGTILANTSGGSGSISASFDNAGSIAVSNGDTLSIYGGLTNNGAISVGSGGHLTIGYGSGSGQFTINDGGTLELSGTISNAVTFTAGAVGTLALDAVAGPDPLTGTLSGLGVGDAIDFIEQTVTQAVLQGNTLTATLAGGQTTSLTISGALPAGASLQTKLDGKGGTDVVVSTGPLPPPATYSWSDGTSGNWNAGSNWSGGVVPDGTSNATVVGTGSETVSVSDTEAANNLTLNEANATLDVSGILSAYGVLTVSAAQQINILGTLSVGINAATFNNANITIGGAGPTPPGFPVILMSGNLNALGSVTFGRNANINLVDGQIGVYGGTSAQSILINQGTITADSSGGYGYIDASALDNEGAITVSNGESLDLSTFGVGPTGQVSSVNNGTISVGSGGHLTLSGQIGGSGSFVIDDGGTLEISGTVSTAVNFAGVATLELDNVANGNPLTGTLSGLATGDAIDFTGVTVTAAVLSGNTLVATLADGQTIDVNVTGSLPTGDSLQLKLDGSGGTDVVVGTGALPPPVTYAWIDGTSGDWITSANWSGGVVPDGTSNATIAGSGVEMITVSNGAANVLTVDDANVTLVVEAYANLSAFGGLTISAAQAINIYGFLSVGGGPQTYNNTTINIGGLASQPGFPGAPSIAHGNLTIEPGAVVTFAANLTVDMAYGQINAYSASPGYSLINDGTIVADTQGGSGNIDVSAFDNEGTITVSNGDTLTLSVLGTTATSVNDGTITVGSGGHLTLQGSISGSGSFVIQDGGTLEINGAVFNDITFAAGGTLRLDQPYYGVDGAAATGTITGFTGSDSIDLANLAFDGQGSASLMAGNLLQVSDDYTVYDLQLAPTDTFSGDFFLLSSDGAGGTLITERPADVIVTSGETTTVSAGTTAQNIYVESGGVLDVAGGVTNVIVVSGGAETISAGGSASTVDDSGLVTVQAGGTVDGLVVNSGGVLDFAGTTLSNVSVSAGATVNVLSGGVIGGNSASYIVVSSGVTLDVQSGGQVDFLVVVSGGTVEVVGAASDIGVIGGTLDVLSGGQFSQANVAFGGVLSLVAGATAENFSVSSGGTVEVAGTVSNQGVLSGGLEIVSSGGVVSGAPGTGTGVSGGTVDVLSGGQFSYATVALGGVVNLEAGASAHNITISSGGTVNVAGTFTHNQVVLSGGLEIVSSGGVVTGTSGSGTAISGGQVDVLSGGELDHSTIYSGGVLEIAGGAIGHNITVSSGGTLIDQGTLTGNITVSSGGTLELLSGGQPGTFNLVSGAILEAGAGYAFDNKVVSSGLTLELASGGTATGTTLEDGGLELVFSGGIDSAAAISGTGVLVVLSGGVADASIINANALNSGGLIVSAGGTASAAQVDSGGFAGLFGGEASDMTINAGGLEVVFSGGIDSGATVSSGGTLVISAGGTAIDTTVESGGHLVFLAGATEAVGSGSALDGDVVSSGVTLDVEGTTSGTAITSGGIETVHGIDSGATISGGGTQNVASGGTAIDTVVDGAVVGAQYVLSGGTASNTTIDGHDIQEVETGGAAYGINLLSGGTEQIDSGGTTTIYDGDLLSGAVIDNGRLIFDLTGTEQFDGSLTGSGSLIVEGGGTLVISSGEAFAGTSVISGGLLDVVGAAAGSVINFEGATGALSLDNAAAFGATIEGFQPGDTIDLPNLSFATLAASSPSYQTVGNDTLVTISADDATTGNPASETLVFAGDYTGQIQLVADHHGGVLVEDVICFMAGTRIATPSGETPVETLRRGDLVTTTDGRAMPVSWLGKQTVSAPFADPLRSWPIRIKAGALGENVPSRDLLLSPCHALLVENVLIQAGALVNGTSIVRETDVPEIFIYYHVELDDHSLILAENTPAETFVDNVDRMGFDNWAEHEALYPSGKPIEEMPYPRAKGRRQVPISIRVTLDERADMICAAEALAAA